MIFKGHIELFDTVNLREQALKRKMDFYEKNHLNFRGINQIEFDIREVFERVYQIHSDYPYVEFVEEGDLSVSRNKVDLEPRACSEKWEYGYKITFNTDLAVSLGRHIGEIFEDVEFIKSRNRMKGYNPKLTVYEKPIYSYPVFERYSICKNEIQKYVRNIAMWFIALHEYAHIINGHCDFKEDDKERYKNLELEQKRGFEVHADLMAAELLFEIVLSFQKYIGVLQIVPQKNGKNPGLTFFEEMVFATVAVYICLRSFLEKQKWDEWTIGIHNMREISHPLTEIRMTILSNFFLNKLSDFAKNELEREVLIRDYLYMINQFESFYYENTSEQKDEYDAPAFYNPTELIKTEEGKRYYKELFDSTLKLNELLKGYMIVPSMITGEWKDYRANYSS